MDASEEKRGTRDVVVCDNEMLLLSIVWSRVVLWRSVYTWISQRGSGFAICEMGGGLRLSSGNFGKLPQKFRSANGNGKRELERVCVECFILVIMDTRL